MQEAHFDECHVYKIYFRFTVLENIYLWKLNPSKISCYNNIIMVFL